jgi:hypothetical protein
MDGDGDVDLADLLAVTVNFGRALLPDSWASTSTASQSTTEPQAPSAVVRSASDRLATEADPAVGDSNLASMSRRRPQGSSTPLSATAVRRPSPRPVDALLAGETLDASFAKRSAAGAAASVRRRRAD